MKLKTQEIAGFVARPPRGVPGALIFGTDAMRVAIKRQDLLQALLGPNAEEEMRLTRMSGADLRKDGTLLMDAIKAQGFFPGPRAAFVEDATDGAAEAIAAALNDWRDGDAQIVVTAGQLTPRSSLRKLFEGHPTAATLPIYDDPMGRDQIEAELKRAGLPLPDRDAMSHLMGLAQELEPGDMRQTLEKLALYKRGDVTPLTADDIVACAPVSTESDVDDLLAVVADGRVGEIGPVMRRLQAQGMQAVGLAIGATRYFRTLHGVAAGANVRLPANYKVRDRMQRHARKWGTAKLEQALEVLVDTDLALRSGGQTAPQLAQMERALIRLAMLGGRADG
ncbi:DNA polymerase III subunit delta [Pseudaestuariivita atlantica]|uniref:DNA-directed DNA polymerase n=1 Tax=Pseudaestuariivita atlantica TaxID=1317121 RepID=A0A0L1JP75_9RHOB|nr:DNA polymerase III subunit delta [Pseudaestuariivita atlantica]KNG93512.1 DNA polymerase III subunit delta [Pseudaestuariivita atlantica]